MKQTTDEVRFEKGKQWMLCGTNGAAKLYRSEGFRHTTTPEIDWAIDLGDGVLHRSYNSTEAKKRVTGKWTLYVNECSYLSEK
jgi:hypothetical protein